MAKVQKPCKTCGKMFTPCADCERDKSMFHWRTVACSLECATAYFAKVEEARNHIINTEIKNEEIKSEEIKSEETENIVLEETINEKVSKSKRIRKQNNIEDEKESE